MQERGLVFSVISDAGTARVLASREALTGALVNLLENAMQNCPPGAAITLSSALENEQVWLRVADTGSGIDAVTLERLFEPFFTTRADGTGLGLAIVRSVAQAHGGEVEVQSTPGQGALFALRLPCVKLE